MSKPEVFPITSQVSREERESRNGHKGLVLWFYGLSGSGKSTVVIGLEKALFNLGLEVMVLDGDNLRHGLNRDLGFSSEARSENLRRAAEIAKLVCRQGTVVLTSFITPLNSDRDVLRSVIGKDFHDVYLDVPLSVCESRDPKGLYKKARAGQLPEMTGIGSPFEAPTSVSLRLQPHELPIGDTLDMLTGYVVKHAQFGAKL